MKLEEWNESPEAIIEPFGFIIEISRDLANEGSRLKSDDPFYGPGDGYVRFGTCLFSSLAKGFGLAKDAHLCDM